MTVNIGADVLTSSRNMGTIKTDSKFPGTSSVGIVFSVFFLSGSSGEKLIFLGRVGKILKKNCPVRGLLQYDFSSCSLYIFLLIPKDQNAEITFDAGSSGQAVPVVCRQLVHFLTWLSNLLVEFWAKLISTDCPKIPEISPHCARLGSCEAYAVDAVRDCRDRYLYLVRCLKQISRCLLVYGHRHHYCLDWWTISVAMRQERVGSSKSRPVYPWVLAK